MNVHFPYTILIKKDHPMKIYTIGFTLYPLRDDTNPLNDIGSMPIHFGDL